jgi:hypothetical protein
MILADKQWLFSDLVMQQGRDQLICNNSLWAASLLKDSSSIVALCPICGKGGLGIIPVGHYESYNMSIDKNSGIEIEFAKEKS